MSRKNEPAVEPVVAFIENVKKGALKDIEMEVKPLEMVFEGFEGVVKKITINHQYKLTLETEKEQIEMNLLSPRGGEDEVISYIFEVLNQAKPKQLNIDGIMHKMGMSVSYQVTDTKSGKFIKGDFLPYRKISNIAV